MSLKKLVILPNLTAKKVSENQIILTRKFIDGISEYFKYWSGEIVVLIEEDFDLSSNLDCESIDVDKLKFRLEIVDFDVIQKHQELDHNSVVLASVGFRQNHISKVCKSNGIPCFYVTEYTLRTRIQIVNATTRNIFLRLRRYIWEISQEVKQRKAIATADGVQCNGLPTYEAYRAINPSPLLYFDTRITENMLASDLEITERTAQCLKNFPLRLCFSGRLTKIKGADHLLLVAQELKKIGVSFEMFICGDGDLRKSMQIEIQKKGLSDSVKMLGVLDFNSELVPFVKKNIDLFLCCHRQGDPSCTYLETMSCGVPILGYANEAFVGVIEQSRVGWSVEMNRPDLLAKKISYLNKNRQAIVNASFESLEFSKLHIFETTFEKRISHIEDTVSALDSPRLARKSTSALKKRE